MTMRERVRIGQEWERKRDHERATVRQVWRADHQVLMNGGTEGRLVVSFVELRRFWRQVVA